MKTPAEDPACEEAAKWNERCPIGTEVLLTDDLGEEHRTRTRSAAWAACGQPLVLVEGRTGGYLLDRIRPRIVHELDCKGCRDLLEAVKLAYRKHQLDDPDIGWDELGNTLCDVICNAIGSDGFCEWLNEVHP